MGFMKQHCFRGCCQGKNRQAKLYNKSGGGWAVVTGGSDGMGLAIAKNLAAQGFNICIVSRNE